jgi:hypothetical protein
MSFLQPILLAALPLVALPIIIHLINQRRFQTIRWGAMMFLLAANRMSRGFARLRQLLIMLCRMAAIAGLIFAISRPLAGGWLGLFAGGKPDTTLILVDRSPSMQQAGAGGGGSKLQTGLQQLTRTLETIGSAHWILIESTQNKPRELKAVEDLLTSPDTGPASASADVPSMLQAAYDYIKANKAGRTEVWICSDIRANDWNADSGRWQALRGAFGEFAQTVRFHLLAYPQPAPENLSVRVTDVRRRPSGEGAELLVSLRLARETSGTDRESIPVQFEIDGARSEATVELAGSVAELKDHRIPLEKSHEKGWGRVSIPADANPADNDFWFVFEQPVPRRTIIVSEDAQAARPLQLAAGISPAPVQKSSADVVAPGQLAAVDWNQASLLLWQSPLPEASDADLVGAFVERGGSAIFFAPRIPSEAALFGANWTKWSEHKGDLPIESWRGDEDLLAHTASGAPLPVGQLQVAKHCGITGELTPLATLKGGAPLLARVATSGGAAYFCTTTPAGSDSSLAREGIVLYVLIQRALAGGANALGSTQALTAGGATRDDPALWQRVAGGQEAMSTDYSFHRGIYQSSERLLAVNRATAEDSPAALADERISGLFRGLDFARVDDRAGSASALIQEIWRAFLIAMLMFMVAEAILCVPKLARTAGASP